MNISVSQKRPKTRADFKTILRIAKHLSDKNVLRQQEGSEYWEYVGHWSDDMVARHIETDVGYPVSASSVKHIRQDEFGHLQPARFAPGSNLPPTVLKEMTEEVAKLRNSLVVTQQTQDRHGARLYELEQHNKMLGKYRDADLLKRQDMLEAENRALLNQINQLKLKIQHG